MKNADRELRKGLAAVAGFTLIELLTVIAIIAILAGLTAVAVPNYLNKAQETKTKANMKSVADLLREQVTRTGNTSGYPPAYGYIKAESKDVPLASMVDTDHVLVPYTYTLGIHTAEDLRQVGRYGTSYDSNRDDAISLFEYLPIGERNAATNDFEFSAELYTGGNMPISGVSFNEVNEQKDQERFRPYVYIPFNKRQLDAMRRYWLDASVNDPLGSVMDTSNALINGRLFFPPAQLDAFVLIGNGPNGNDGGLLSVGPPGTPGTDYDAHYTYYMTALRIAFLATRDLDGDEKKDFSYEDRKQANVQHILPDGTNGGGPFILVVQ